MSNPIEMVVDMIIGNKLSSSSGSKFPCSTCYKTVLANQKAIHCDTCSLCDGTTVESYKEIMENV